MKEDTTDKITYAVLMKKTGLMMQIMKSCNFETGSLEIDAVNLHILILKSGLQLRTAFSALASLGESVDERIRRDKQKSRMVGALQAHALLKSHMVKLEDMIDRHIRKADSAQRELLQDLTVDLLGLESGSAFQHMLEHDLLYDTMSRHFVVHGESLHNMCKKIEKGLENVTKENNWKATLVSADPIEKVLEAGSKLLKMELKAVPFKTTLETLEQEI